MGKGRRVKVLFRSLRFLRFTRAKKREEEEGEKQGLRRRGGGGVEGKTETRIRRMREKRIVIGRALGTNRKSKCTGVDCHSGSLFFLYRGKGI